MEGGAFLGADDALLQKLTDRQLGVLLVLGQPELRHTCQGGADVWQSLVTEARARQVDERDVQDLLCGFQEPESLRSFVLTDLHVTGDENEQAEALLRVAGELWYRTTRAEERGEPASARFPDSAGPTRRHTGVTRWDGDIWCAYDTEQNVQVYVHSEHRPADAAGWDRHPPRFRSLSRHGDRHWCGYDGADGRWMYIEHTGRTPPAQHAPGWTAEPPRTPDPTVAPQEDAPELDEAVRSLMEAVRSGAVGLGELATPLRYARGWAALPSLGNLAAVAAGVQDVLGPTAGPRSKGDAYGPISDLGAELQRLGSRFAAMERWPTGWDPGDAVGPDRFTHVLRLGCQDLRRSVRRIARAPAGTPLGEIARRGPGRDETSVRLLMGNLTNFAWAMGRTGCRSETFADPLGQAEQLAALAALQEACPDLTGAARLVADCVGYFRTNQILGRDYEHGLRQAQRIFRRYSENLYLLEDRWPGWDGADEAMPAEGPTAFAAMIRLGWQMLEAERRELRTFVEWENTYRPLGMGRPKAPGKGRLGAVRAGLAQRTAPLSPLSLPDLADLRALAHASTHEGWPPDTFAHPLAALRTWRTSASLRGGYPEFRDRAAAVARLYDHRLTDAEAYRDAVARLLAVLEAIRTVLGLLGSEWPETWGADRPEQPPALLRLLVDDGKRELRRSARNLSEDLRTTSPAGTGRHAPRSSADGPPRHGAAPSRRKPRQHSGTSPLRRFLFGSGRRR
ncbi:hypothetical protein ACIQWR_37740 [Streptomyces sp. NPDC098789]|uniref:hypothetical protein n=1 Tax=Streptomyces sp. NPDC098789 TaxID=3366098 RepID=UPI003829173E